MVELTRKEYKINAEHRGIKKPQNMSTKKSINTLSRYDSKRKGEKLLKIGLGKVAKIPNIWENEVNQAEKLQKKSIDELKEIARLRRIKNRDKLTKESLLLVFWNQKTAMQNVIIWNILIIILMIIIIILMMVK